MGKYKPEIIAAFLLITYTVVRTIVVAQGISPVSQVDWRIFLAIELITTIPYVWAMGDIIRRANKREHTAGLRRRTTALLVAISSLLAPYAYLGLFGSLTTSQGIFIFTALLLVFTVPSLVKLIGRMRNHQKRKHV